MKWFTAMIMALTLCLGLSPLAHADEIWTVYADSTLAGNYGYLVTFADETGSGDTIFITNESGRARFVASRLFGETQWAFFPAGWYVAPGSGDSAGSNWTTIEDDLGRQSRSYFEAVEPYSGPLGTLTTARCTIRPDVDTGIVTETRYWSQGAGLVADDWPGEGTDILTDFNIVGGTGYFPLAVGNSWNFGWVEAEPAPVNGTPLALNLLHACAPNPFNPQTEISFEMGTDAPASLRIFDTAGRLVKTLVNEQRAAGMHAVTWNGRDEAGRAAAAGVYLYRFETGESVQTRRMTLVK